MLPRILTLVSVMAMLGMLLAGCARPTLGTWSKADLTTFDQDQYACRREATFAQNLIVPVYGYGGVVGHVGTTRTNVDRELFSQCMKARGYQRIAD